MTPDDNGPTIGAPEESSSWLYDHIGRLIGLFLGVLVFFVLVWLAAIGYTPALGLIIFFVSGTLLIYGGGKIHRA